MPKHRIEGKVESWHSTIFRVGKVASYEQEILVHFGHRVKYQVVKLSSKDLPPRDFDGKRIFWINNFAVVDSSGRYVKKVNYTVFLPALPKHTIFIYSEHGRLKRNKTPRWKGSKWPRPHMVQVDFNTGDPGVGCRDAPK